MTVYLLLAAVVMLACVLLGKISSKLGIPVLLAFILLGMFFGSDGLVKIPFDDYGFAEQICSAALIFIIFYGGFGTRWKEARSVAVKAGLLSTLGVVLTAGFTGLFCHYALGIGWVESFILGSVIGSTDAASVFSILRSKKLALRYGTASLLELESGSNDPCSYMLTVVFLAVAKGGMDGGKLAYMVFAQLVYGAAAGVLLALSAVWMLRRFSFRAAGSRTIFVLAVAILSYAIPAACGGNGYLGAYICGIVLGNSDIGDKKTLVSFFDGVTELMQILVFFLLGLLSAPSALPSVLLPALLISLFLTFVARPAAVFAILSSFRCNIRQQLVVSWCGLRGAASIVFAVLVKMSSAVSSDIFHTVFCVVLFSILFQGSLLPLLSRRLGMIDENADVMRTFTDYSEEEPVQFIRFLLPPGHPFCGKPLRDIVLPPDTLAVLLLRDNKHIVPSGNTLLAAGDTVILSAGASGEIDGVRLSEKKIGAEAAGGIRLADAAADTHGLIIMVKRGRRIIIPKGNTVIKPGDTLVINNAD